MKFLERFSISIFSVSGTGGSFRSVLRGGAKLLHNEILEQIRSRLISQQTKEGGFPDRAGKCDLYYTLFGFFLADALEIDQVFPALKDFVEKASREHDHQGIDLFCMTILHASLFPDDTRNRRFAGAIRKITDNRELLMNGYTPFLVILSLLVLHDYYGVVKVLKAIGDDKSEVDKPCPVVAAQQLVAYLKSGRKRGKNSRGDGEFPGPFKDFYRDNGGFAALKHTREPDLLSTATALFVLRFKDYDLRLIRPDSLEFINGLYFDGGFTAGNPDAITDVEYTFYGLLALGSLNPEYGQN